MNSLLEFAGATGNMTSKEIKEYFDLEYKNQRDYLSESQLPDFSTEEDVIEYLRSNGIYNFSTTAEIFGRIERKLFGSGTGSDVDNSVTQV
mgnify:CR=1 FL=1